ncbi:hypothetical protein [Streptomyces sp. NPDC051909]|uniref:hypothetical protein n=1 Tax=Streptomyces sp. NPDC051909 TaxID=3154944 RepID=UPI003418F98C
MTSLPISRVPVAPAPHPLRRVTDWPAETCRRSPGEHPTPHGPAADTTRPGHPAHPARRASDRVRDAARPGRRRSGIHRPRTAARRRRGRAVRTRTGGGRRRSASPAGPAAHRTGRGGTRTDPHDGAPPRSTRSTRVSGRPGVPVRAGSRTSAPLPVPAQMSAPAPLRRIPARPARPARRAFPRGGEAR